MLPPIRSLLFVPGARPDRFAKAMAAGADAVAFDLEDSVEPGRKAEARAAVAEFLAAPPPSAALRLVRVNAGGGDAGRADLEAFRAVDGFDGLLVPKVEDREALDRVQRAFTDVGRACPPLLALLESPRAILRALEIASAAAPVGALLFGAEDLTARLGIARTVDGDELLVARSHVALAAAAAGAEPIDAICTALDDLAVLRRDAERAHALGFKGKMAIHPKQVAVINEVFTPSAGEIARARRVVEAFEAATAEGQGVTRLDGQMVELPVVERARRILALADRYTAS